MLRVLALPWLMLSFAAQTQAQRPSDYSQKLVTLTVVATDAKGVPITDLRTADIQVHEDGKPYPVAFFRYSGSRRPVAQPGPGEFINRPDPPLALVLLDRWNEKELTMASAWQDVVTTLEHLETVDRVYIYFLTNHGELLPVRALPGAEADLRAAAPPTSADLIARLNDAVRTTQGLRDSKNLDPVQSAQLTLQDLTLVSRMASLPGRKNLVWVTHGFPLEILNLTSQWVDFTTPIQQSAQAAVRSQVAIYTVDQSAQGAGADVAGLSRQTLERFASLTGGRWYSSGRTADALAGISADARGSYRIAYYSPARESGWREHKIRLDSSRKGVHLLTLEGYFGDEAPLDPDQMAEEAFAGESHSPFEATDIPLRVAASRKQAAVHVEIHVEPGDIFLEHRGERFQGSLSVKFALYRNGVYEDAAPTTSQDLDYTQEQYDLALKNGIVISRDVSVTDKIQQVRVMVYDRGIHELGSVTVPVG